MGARDRTRARALQSENDAAERLFREAIDRFGRTRLRVELARAHLLSALGLDPADLRLRNRAEADARGDPWSSDGLEDCLRLGAEQFGWQQREPTSRSRRDGDWLIGSGMATAAYPVALFRPTQHARARLYAHGSAVVQTATQEFGTGVTTAMTQVAADALALTLDAVRFQAGDTDLPSASAAVALAGAGTMSAAAHAAATALRNRLVAMAIADDESPLHGADPAALEVRDGRTMLRDQPETGETYGELVQRNPQADAEASGSWTPPPHGHAPRAADVRRPICRGRRRPRAWAHSRATNARRLRPRGASSTSSWPAAS
jgi:xanthine dehydrogenase YagR molybdenum-binding subunit